MNIDNVNYNNNVYNKQDNLSSRKGKATDSEAIIPANQTTFHSLPVDVVRLIFTMNKENLPSFASVCTTWKALLYDNDFRNMMIPKNIFSSAEWEKYFHVETEESPELPLCAFVEKGENLFFIPDKVKIKNVNGEVEELKLDNFNAFQKLVKNAENGSKIIFSNHTIMFLGFVKDNITETRNVDKAHWALIKENDKEYDYIINKEKNCATYMETALSTIIEYVRSGKKPSGFILAFEKDPAHSKKIPLGFVCSSDYYYNNPNYISDKLDIYVIDSPFPNSFKSATSKKFFKNEIEKTD